MAERAVWRGHLRLALVSCPVALHTAHHEHANLHFHFVNPETGNRVRMPTVDAETGTDLLRRDLVQGYEFRKGEYLILDDADFAAARIDSSTVLNVDKFVPEAAIDTLYYDTGYYLVPDGDAGLDVYAVLRDAIVRSKRVALTRVVIARRERALAIRPMGRGLVAHTLYEARDIYDAAEQFAAVPATGPDAEMVKLAMQLIDRQSARFDPADMEDRYEARLRAVIEAKLKGEGIAPEAEQEDGRGRVIDLMQALKRSLGQTTEKPAARSARRAGPKARPGRKRA